ncbi:MAG: 1-acyl-sn-glycerol-3-phosphate acyltransferase [Acidobacteriota bacterium]
MSSTAGGTRLHRPIRRLARLLLHSFYPDLSITGLGRVPDGPLVVAANHPNSIIDPLLLSAWFPRPIRWLAKAPLFEHPLAAKMLSSFGVIPVRRRHEGRESRGTNPAIETAAEAVAEGTVLGIFPEGLTHLEPRLKRLRKGVAHVARRAAELSGEPVQVLPVVLHFPDRARFRSEAAIVIGEPIAVDAELESDAFMSVLEERLSEQLVAVDDGEHEELLTAFRVIERSELADRIGADDPGERHALDLAVARAIRRFSKEEPERLDDFRQRLVALAEQLDLQGISAASLDLRTSHRRITGRALSLLGLPVLLLGLLQSGPPYWLAGRRARRRALVTGAPSQAWHALLSGTLLFPLYWGLLALGLHAWLGPVPAVLSLLVAPFLGLITRRGVLALRSWRREWRLRLRHPRHLQQMRAERASLREEIERWRGMMEDAAG